MRKIIDLQPIGRIISPFKEKFGIPRQPGLLTIESKICLYDDFQNIDCIRGLEKFSHIWIIFYFHQNSDKGWKNLVRPPRLGGNIKTGVFASRSPFRPNFIGLSAVRLEKIQSDNGLTLVISGGDFLDGTPVFDIKPYVKYADAIEDADSSCFSTAPERVFKVCFQNKTIEILEQNPGLREKLVHLLSYDLRPAYYNKNKKIKNFGIKFENFDIKFNIQDLLVIVDEIV